MTEYALLELLAAERRALRAGRIDELSRYAEQKAAIVSRLREGSAPQSVLDEVKRAADENERLLRVALSACERANIRLAAAKARACTVGYDPAGERLTHTEQSDAIERRV